MPRFEQQRTQLMINLYSEGIAEETSMRDLCGQSKWEAVRQCVAFLKECGLKFCER
jgi:hypothetical protein